MTRLHIVRRGPGGNVAHRPDPGKRRGAAGSGRPRRIRQVAVSLCGRWPLSGDGRGGPESGQSQQARCTTWSSGPGTDIDAYAELVDRHGGLAYRVALRLLGNHQDAEDVAQEALICAWQRLPGFRGESSFSTWLYRIVTRRALNRMTRTRVADSLDLLADVRGRRPGQSVERDLTVDAVTAAVAALPPPSAWLSSCTTSRAWPTRRSPASPGQWPGRP